MEDQIQDSIIFAMHIGLLAAKIIAVLILGRMFIIKKALDKNSFIFVGKFWLLWLLFFTIIVLLSEIWILSNYYLISSDFDYEAIAILDQIILTVALIVSYKGGSNNGS